LRTNGSKRGSGRRLREGKRTSEVSQGLAPGSKRLKKRQKSKVKSDSALFDFCLYLRLQRRKRFACSFFHFGVETVAVRVHGDDCRKVVNLKMPHGFRDSELEQMNA